MSGVGSQREALFLTAGYSFEDKLSPLIAAVYSHPDVFWQLLRLLWLFGNDAMSLIQFDQYYK